MKKYVVTGGSGFIGSALVKFLLNEGNNVTAIDKKEFSEEVSSSQKAAFNFVRIDLLEAESEIPKILRGHDAVLHLSANSSIKLGSDDRMLDLSQNVIVTKNLLEAMIPQSSPKKMVFASTSAVYGQADVLPTPETYGPLKPLSLYAASKLSCESIISAYSNMSDFSAIALRLANVTGPADTHGIIYDFNRQIKLHPSEIVILSDGKPKKSYVHVDDCVRAFLLGLSHASKGMDIVNVGNVDQVDVYSIAAIFKKMKDLKETEIRILGGKQNGGGWVGDVTDSFMDISKIKSLGWAPSYNSTDTIRKTISML